MNANKKREARASPWLTPAEAAAYLGIAVGTIRNWTSARYVPFAKRGRVVRYHRTRLDEWLNKGSCSGRKTITSAAIIRVAKKARSKGTKNL